MELVTGGSVEELLSVRRVLDAAASGNHRVEPNEVDRDFVPYTGADIVMSICNCCVTTPRRMGERSV